MKIEMSKIEINVGEAELSSKHSSTIQFSTVIDKLFLLAKSNSCQADR